MHPSFESLVVTNAPGLQTSLMDIHHNTSLKSIFSSTFKARIHFCLGKGLGLWLVVRPSICLFHIAHFTFTLTLCFCFGLIQPLASNIFMCECEHMLDISSTHLTYCPFGGHK
jgi:hypothetical protein